MQRLKTAHTRLAALEDTSSDRATCVMVPRELALLEQVSAARTDIEPISGRPESPARHAAEQSGSPGGALGAHNASRRTKRPISKECAGDRVGSSRRLV